MSDRPRLSEVPSEPAPASHIEESSDFGRWLTRDLRTKGTPSQAPPSQAPPPPEPSQLSSIVVAAPEEPDLASWLLTGLKPRGSVPPDVALVAQGGMVGADDAPTPQAGPVDALFIPVDVEAAAAGRLSPPDSLMPHVVSERPRAGESGALLALSDDALDADDLAVLPSRKRASGQRRWRHVAVAALLLGTLGVLFWRGTGSQVEAARADAAASAPQAAEPLPPPPPAQEDIVALPEEPEPAPVHHASGSAAPSEPDDLSDLPGRAGRRAGDAIARFADLPPPTLSKLAREERQKIREREARARTRKTANRAAPEASTP